MAEAPKRGELLEDKMKFAVIRTGGKQYKVREGQFLRVEKLAGEAGSSITLDEVLLVAQDGGAVTVGRPTIAGASVKADIVQHGLGKKVLLAKYKPAARAVKRGHRQAFTQLKVTSIQG
jgi:large subunit ribosomal protein L21